MAKDLTKKDLLLLATGLIVFAIILDFTPIGGSNIRVYATALSCKQWPVQKDANLTGEVPHYTTVPGFSSFAGQVTLFCSPYDAEMAGYSAEGRTYSFPHLPKSEFQNAIKKSRGF